MRHRLFFSHRSSPPTGHHTYRCFSLALLLIAIFSSFPLRAQDAPPSEPGNSAPYTLHLYARLVELPTMILLRRDQTLLHLDPQQINIKLNAAPPFHPTSLRLEGNDPLSIAILLDVSGDQRDLLSAIQKDFSTWVATSLRPQDHVSIYALDCDLLQTSNDVPANPTVLQKGLDLALTSQLPHGASTKPSCGKSIRLRSSLLVVMRRLSRVPGRRTLLVVTGGRDAKAKIDWSQLTSEAGLDSVTVFALTSPGPMEFQRMIDVYTLTHDSGGFLFSPTPNALPKALDQLIGLLRTRYILQVPMPADLTPVTYHVFITVPKFDVLILPSGVTVPLANPSVDHPSTDLPYEAPLSDPHPTPNR